MDSRIEQLIQELLQADPALQSQEPTLRALAQSMLRSKPDTAIRPTFRAELRQQLVQRVRSGSQPHSLTSWLMSKFILVPIAVLAALIIVPTVLLKNSSPKQPPASTGPVAITALGHAAFGPLGTAQPVGLGGSSNGGNGNVNSNNPTTYRGPYYRYLYSGSNPQLPNWPVLRREQTLDRAQLDAAGVIRLSTFDTVETDPTRFGQTAASGYTAFVDLQEGVISVSRSWDSNAAKDAVTGKNTTGLPSQLLADETLIGIARAFLDAHGIGTTGFGQPVVQKDGLPSGRVPSEIAVLYPWKVDGHDVYNEGGFRYGMTVTIDVATSAVNSVSNIAQRKFQSSAYDLATDAAAVLNVARRGGVYNTTPAANAKVTDVPLLAPHAGYLISRYQLDQTTHEYLVPALFFPLGTPASGEKLYQKAIAVPVVQDLLNATATR